MPARAVAFSSRGQPLKGWLIDPGRDPTKTGVVLVHGWGSNHESTMSLAKPMLEAGHPVFLFDVRCHGESPPASFVTARHFRDDVLSAVGKTKALLPQRGLALVGHSMGGSAAILAVVEGAPVLGLVTLAAPADLRAVWAYHLDRRGLPGAWVVRILGPSWRVRAGVPFRMLQPDLRAREMSLPTLVLHGERDESVAPWHAERLGAAAGVDPVLLPERRHSDLLDSPKVHQRVLGFLRALDHESSREDKRDDEGRHEGNNGNRGGVHEEAGLGHPGNVQVIGSKDDRVRRGRHR